MLMLDFLFLLGSSIWWLLHLLCDLHVGKKWAWNKRSTANQNIILATLVIQVTGQKQEELEKGRACVAFYVMQHEQEEESRWELTLHCTMVNNVWVRRTKVPEKAGWEGWTLMLFLHFLSESCTWCVSRLSCQRSTIQKHKKEPKIPSIQTRQWERWLEIIKSRVLHTFK